MPAKDELRKTIQSRRVARGLGYLHPSPEQPLPLEQLSVEDLEKRRLRRENNRTAASRCRMRRKERVRALQKSAEELKATNDMVEKDIEKLRAEKDELIDMLSSHQCAMRTSRKPSSP